MLNNVCLVLQVLLRRWSEIVLAEWILHEPYKLCFFGTKSEADERRSVWRCVSITRAGADKPGLRDALLHWKPVAAARQRLHANQLATRQTNHFFTKKKRKQSLRFTCLVNHNLDSCWKCHRETTTNVTTTTAPITTGGIYMGEVEETEELES